MIDDSRKLLYGVAISLLILTPLAILFVRDIL